MWIRFARLGFDFLVRDRIAVTMDQMFATLGMILDLILVMLAMTLVIWGSNFDGVECDAY